MVGLQVAEKIRHRWFGWAEKPAKEWQTTGSTRKEDVADKKGIIREPIRLAGHGSDEYDIQKDWCHVPRGTCVQAVTQMGFQLQEYPKRDLSILHLKKRKRLSKKSTGDTRQYPDRIHHSSRRRIHLCT